MPDDLAKRLEPIVTEVVDGLGFDLDALEVRQAGRQKVVKVVVDCDDGIDMDEIATTTKAVSKALDQHDHVIVGSYTLEVTSPGLSRPLSKPRHWRRAKFRLVKITPKEGKPYVGRVGHAGERAARVLVDERIKDVAYAGVASAVIEIEFKQPPTDELKLLEADDVEITSAAKTPDKRHTGDKTKEEDAR
jgi:ribosome maturation factor RimP